MTKSSASDRERGRALVELHHNSVQATTLADDIAAALAAARREGLEQIADSEDFERRLMAEIDIALDGEFDEARRDDCLTQEAMREALRVQLFQEGGLGRALPLPEQNTESNTREDG